MLLLASDRRLLSGNSGFQLFQSLLQLRAGTTHHYRLVPKSAVRHTNSNKSNVFGRTLFSRVHISDIGAVVHATLADDSLSNTDIAVAVDVGASLVTDSRVDTTNGVARERVPSNGSVVRPGCVTKERKRSDGCVAMANIVIKRPKTRGRVLGARVAEERFLANGRIKVADGIAKRANAPLAVFWTPVVLLRSAPAPVAVLLSAVLARSVPAPTAVLNSPVVNALSDSQPTAVLAARVVTLKKAFCPSAVLKFG